MSLNTLKYTLNGEDYEPINKGDITFTTSLNTESGSYQYVRELSGDLLYDKAAYTYITNHGTCQKISLEISEKNGQVWLPIYKGYFTQMDGETNVDKKLFKVQPKEDTYYNCILDSIDSKFNMLQVGTVVNAERLPAPQLEFDFVFASAGDYYLPFYGDYIECGGGTGSSPIIGTFVFAREVQVTYCQGGEPQQPEGTGWELLINNCSGAGWSKWVRRADTLDNMPCVGSWDITGCTPPCTPATPAAPSGEQWIAAITKELSTQIFTLWVDWNEVVAVYGGITNLNNGRNLVDVIEYGINQICPELDLQSNFLRNTINPVTGQTPSSSKDVQVHSISDIKSPNASLPATLEEVTLKDLLESVCANKFNCFWRIDEGTRKLVIEHYIDLTFGNPSDLTAIESGRWLKQKNTFTYDKSDTPNEEVFDSLDVSIDFTGVPIKYKNNPCASGVKNYNINNIYTEVDAIVANPTEYPNDGIVLILPESLAPPQSITPSGARSELGAITGIYAANMPMSTANLHNKFWKQYRPFAQGYMNFDSTEFTAKPTKKLQTIQIPICSYFYFNPNAEFITNLGANGRLVSATFNPKTYFLELEIIY